jgi:hypothetical protein
MNRTTATRADEAQDGIRIAMTVGNPGRGTGIEVAAILPVALVNGVLPFDDTIDVFQRDVAHHRIPAWKKIKASR